MALRGKEFLWGASIANYQTDGAENTQWHEWEFANADRLASDYDMAFKDVPTVDDFRAAGNDPQNYISGMGIHHRERYDSDFDKLQALNFNAFRFSVEWARVEPEEGVYDESEIAFLKDYIASIKSHGMTPVLTLWHWTMPLWFTEKGAFEKRENERYFEEFAAYVLQKLQDDIDIVLTFNEWNVYTFAGYIAGEWAPMQTSFLTAFKVALHLTETHNRVYDIAKMIKPAFKVSVAHNTADFIALNRKVTTKLGLAWNRWQRDNFFLDRTYQKMDFLGLNWYNADSYDGFTVKNPNEKVNDMGWDMRPIRIEKTLVRLYNRYQLPILITENGLADGDDSDREWWLSETLQALENAENAGVDLMGYLHWSAFDNFEWDKGYWPRFGLIAVDYENDYARDIRPSAQYYATRILEYRGK